MVDREIILTPDSFSDFIDDQDDELDREYLVCGLPWIDISDVED